MNLKGLRGRNTRGARWRWPARGRGAERHASCCLPPTRINGCSSSTLRLLPAGAAWHRGTTAGREMAMAMVMVPVMVAITPLPRIQGTGVVGCRPSPTWRLKAWRARNAQASRLNTRSADASAKLSFPSISERHIKCFVFTQHDSPRGAERLVDPGGRSWAVELRLSV